MGRDRLLEVYIKSDRIKFDDKDKFVILSDVHRGDGSNSDSLISNRNIYFAALSHYYKEGFTLIEAGDGDELWKNKSYVDIAYNYKGIFRLLNLFKMENRLHLIYGNHDQMKCSKDYINKQIRRFKSISKDFGHDFVNLIKDTIMHEGLVLNYTPLNKDILIAHGHQVDFFNYELCIVSRFLVRYIWRFMNGIAGFKEPTSPANNYKKGGAIDEKLEKWSKDNKICLICGHTHKSRFPKVGEGIYFNDGCCVMPYSISTIEINNGIIELIRWSTYVREDATLYIARNVIGGPERLKGYLINTR